MLRDDGEKHYNWLYNPQQDAFLYFVPKNEVSTSMKTQRISVADTCS
jgi:hypothetical protein